MLSYFDVQVFIATQVKNKTLFRVQMQILNCISWFLLILQKLRQSA